VEPLARFVGQADGALREVDEQLPAGCRANMPADWSEILGGEFLGRVRFTRAFHKPTGLDLGERVFLVVEAPRSHGVVKLNRKPVGEVRYGSAPLRVDVTDLLGGDERLEIVVQHDSHEVVGGLVGEVRLEIEE
jgi:hypothetical protein